MQQMHWCFHIVATRGQGVRGGEEGPRAQAGGKVTVVGAGMAGGGGPKAGNGGRGAQRQRGAGRGSSTSAWSALLLLLMSLYGRLLGTSSQLCNHTKPHVNASQFGG